MSRYTFGDDDPAATRLGLVADAYRPSSTSFVAGSVPDGAGLVVDLGCGPGYSTELLSEACRPRRLVGLDVSPSFVTMARIRVPDAEFAVHDASRTPLPTPAADVLYARLLLAHLADPLDVARRWQKGLRPGGVVLIEDLEDVEAPEGPLREYERVSTAIVRAGGGPMYAGRALGTLGGTTAAVVVPAQLAAEIYLLNVERWLEQRPAPVEPRRLDTLAAGLRDVREGGPGTVSWLVRQLALPVR